MSDLKDVREYERGYHEALDRKEYGVMDLLFGPGHSDAYWQGYKEGKEDRD